MALTPAERKAALGHGGMAKLARRTRRTLGHVSQVIHGKRRDAKVERVAAAMLSRPIEEVFAPELEKAGAA